MGSPTIVLLRQQYERAGVFAWNNDRVSNLCKALNITLQELCARAGLYKLYKDGKWRLDHAAIDHLWEKDVWPGYLAMHFMAEAHSIGWKAVQPGLTHHD
jgi:hypothetical protein